MKAGRDLRQGEHSDAKIGALALILLYERGKRASPALPVLFFGPSAFLVGMNTQCQEEMGQMTHDEPRLSWYTRRNL